MSNGDSNVLNHWKHGLINNTDQQNGLIFRILPHYFFHSCVGEMLPSALLTADHTALAGSIIKWQTRVVTLFVAPPKPNTNTPDSCALSPFLTR